MKKLLIINIGLLILYVILLFVTNSFNREYEINYIIADKYKINERKINDESGGYIIEFKINDLVYTYQTYEKFNGKKIISDIKYYEGENLKCFLPVFNNNRILVDYICFENDNIKYYHNLTEKPFELEKFIKEQNVAKYNQTNYQNWYRQPVSNSSVTLYKGNKIDNQSIGIVNYRGLLSITDKILPINLFTTDVYSKDLEVFVNNYYMSADYNQKYKFNKMFIINYANGKQYDLKLKKEISFDSYIQGVVDKKVYLFDRDAKKQYEIDLDNKSIDIVSNSQNFKNYVNGKWEEKPLFLAVNDNVLFNIEKKSDEQYEIIEKINNKIGYTYYYQKTDNGYDVYRSTNINLNQKTFLFHLSEIRNIIYLDDFIYFVENNEIKYYSDKTGIKTIIKDSELEFNKLIKYNVYKD